MEAVPRPPPPKPVRQSAIEHVFFFLLLAAVTFAFVGLISDFLVPVFWAAVFAVVFYPMNLGLRERLNGRSGWAALGSVILILLVVILPLVLVGMVVSREAQSLFTSYEAGDLDLSSLFESLRPTMMQYLQAWGIDLSAVREAASQAAAAASQWVASSALELGQNALRVGAMSALMVYILFFFLRDGEDILDALVRVLPLGDARERHLFARFAEATRATLRGTVVVALVQGALGGVLFYAVGITAPVLWGVAMAVASLLPAVGAGLVWAPAGVVLIATGSTVRGVVVLAAGGGLVSTVDNVLRPRLVSHETRIPDYLILLATLGGLALFGLSGFIIGPVLAALFLAVWRMFEDEYALAKELEPEHEEDVDPLKKRRVSIDTGES